MRLQKGRWIGNQWASIEIEPVSEEAFLPLLAYLAQRYGFEMPAVVDRITGYAADFAIEGTAVTLDLDTYDFSIAFADDAIRDRVWADLTADSMDLPGA